MWRTTEKQRSGTTISTRIAAAVLAAIISVTSLADAQTASPCPKVFSYEPRGVEQDRWFGILSLSSKEDLNGVWIHIKLDTPAELLGNWFGEASSPDNMEYTIKNPKYKLEAGPPVSVRFFVKYNAAAKIPSVIEVILNGKTICSTRRENVQQTTPTLHISQLEQSRPSGTNTQREPEDIYGELTSKRPGSNINQGTHTHHHQTVTNHGAQTHNQQTGSNQGRPTSGVASGGNNNNAHSTNSGSNGLSFEDSSETSQSDFDFFPGDFNIHARPSVTRPVPSRPLNNLNKRNVECGTVAMQASPLISYGQNTSQGQWPWHVALYHSQGTSLMYTCGGTLITENHVITAAHCVTKPQTNRALNPLNVLNYLGKYNLKKFGPEVQVIDTSSIHVHPQYNYTVYFNDVAIVKLARSAEINNYVRPCCLWDEDVELDNVINKHGTVVGWGFDENRQLSNILMQAQMPIVSTVKCIYSNREFFSQFTFEKNFCAGFRNGTSVCNGDSGGGMVFPKSGTSGRNLVWQLRGLVSVGVALQGQGVCDPSHYIVFTDVAKHLDWIKQTMRQ